MANFFDPIKRYIKADWWSGAYWLLMLCFLQVLLAIFYIVIHTKRPGYEYVQLDTQQVRTLNDLLSLYPDTQFPTSLLEEGRKRGTDTAYKRVVYDSIVNLRAHRTLIVGQFLRTIYKGDAKGQPNEIDSALRGMDSTLRELNTKDVATYITAKRFRLSSYFWLSGVDMYWEAVLWSLLGVITSLIYYVSLANQLLLKKTRDDDIGQFDTSEIAPQVAKMFYAPAITLVLVLGYSFISGNNKSVVDISVNHGLILFAFIAGFYSGRVMKLLDGLKNLLLPVASDGVPPLPDTPAAPATIDIAVTLQLSDAMSKDPHAADIIEAGFNAAEVALTPAGGGDSIPLNKPADDQGAAFTGTKIAPGKYTINVKYAFDDKKTIVNLTGSQDVEVSSNSKTFTVMLSQDNSQG